ncbi:hypothetical protein Gotri_016021 [Gossypium trilobum]|uniref:Uncharacterized protein n=1 Tax=Gossypium trilobum TaxID=34281 RepID=A0A7J9E209_9ROSI|nr:hypothetical protein [Gossypium trilobum]
MWENRYDHILIQEPIIISELACVLDYMPSFMIHGKPFCFRKSRGVSKTVSKGNDRAL